MSVSILALIVNGKRRKQEKMKNINLAAVKTKEPMKLSNWSMPFIDSLNFTEDIRLVWFFNVLQNDSLAKEILQCTAWAFEDIDSEKIGLQTETPNVLRIVMKHLLEAENPPQLLAETQEVLLKCSNNNKLARNIYQRYLALPLLVRYAYAERFEWFEAVAEQRQGEDNNTLSLEFQMIKIKSFYAIFYSISEEIREKFEQPGHTLLFHGAKQASSVDDVLNNGINLNCGRSHLDFSSGSGFYLSDDYEAAEEWVTKKEHRPSAVIIYRVPNNLLEYGKTAGVDLNKQTWLWSYIVKYYRREHTFGFDLMDLVLNRSFYKGPVCRNGVQIRKGNHDSPTPLVINGKEIQQYCIRRKNLAQKFNSLVVGVVIYV